MSDMPQRRAICQLCFAEQLVVWAARAWLTGRDGRARVKAELARAFGDVDGQATAAALGGFVAVLDSAALRTLYLGPMTCRMVWPDEERLLATVRYVHADLEEAAQRVLEPILPPAARRAALERASALARHLADAGYRIGFGGPLSPDAVAGAGRLRPTLH
ncbi:MAG TPA: hypothetical protein VMV26_01620 [Alphaproteobacteria bacterium]|nr:hypothetical protein [Alphaproteobacteria bacterium]